MNYVVPVYAFVFLGIPSHTQDMPTVSIIARFTSFTYTLMRMPTGSQVAKHAPQAIQRSGTYESNGSRLVLSEFPLQRQRSGQPLKKTVVRMSFDMRTLADSVNYFSGSNITLFLAPFGKAVF